MSCHLHKTKERKLKLSAKDILVLYRSEVVELLSKVVCGGSSTIEDPVFEGRVSAGDGDVVVITHIRIKSLSEDIVRKENEQRHQHQQQEPHITVCVWLCMNVVCCVYVYCVCVWCVYCCVLCVRESERWLVEDNEYTRYGIRHLREIMMMPPTVSTNIITTYTNSVMNLNEGIQSHIEEIPHKTYFDNCKSHTSFALSFT